MARDPSPFAQRLKALAGRSGRQIGDASDASGPPQPVGDSSTEAAAVPSTSAAPVAPPAEPAAVDATPPDEQPTGEFPAVSDAANDEPSSAPSLADDQPTTQTPALSPIWLDPPPYDPTPSAPTPGHVDWSPAADDVIEQPSPVADLSAEPSPYLGGEPQDATPEAETPPADIAPAPVWEVEAASAPEAANAASQRPIWEPVPSAQATPPAASAHAEASGDPTTPAWVEEAKAIGEPTGAIVPPPRSTADASPTSPAVSATSEGPTLSPPVLPKKAQAAGPSTDQPLESTASESAPASDQPVSQAPTDVPAPQEAVASAPETSPADQQATIPDESEPMWTPTALHEALTLPEDEPAAPASQAQSSEASSGETASTTEREDQPTQVSDAVATPSGRRGWRPAFGKRKAAAEPAESPQSASLPASEADHSSSESDVPGATQTPASGSVPDATPSDVPPAIELAKRDPTSAAASETDEPTAAPRDPGSITSRLSIVGRRAKTLAARKSAAPSEDQPTEPSSPTPIPAPERREAAPVVVPAPAIKPSFAERSALRRRVKSLRARRDAGLAELGAIVLDQSRFGDPTGGTLVRRRTALLADLDGEIAAIETALEDERSVEAVAQLGVVHCTSCSTLIGPADRFCAHCGTARPSAGADASSATDAS